jgi:alanyl-tRNA synthetase
MDGCEAPAPGTVSPKTDWPKPRYTLESGGQRRWRAAARSTNLEPHRRTANPITARSTAVVSEMTTRLYYTDSYLTDFDARVVERSDDGRRIYLDRTAFYPTSGGQPFDMGTLGAAAVLDVIDEGDRIAHVLSTPLDGDSASGHVDWERRFDHMQQHSGQHLLSAVFADRFGLATVSVHFGRDICTLDLDVTSLDRGRLAEAEAYANALVFENRALSVSFEDAATATGLRKAPDRSGTLRIVTIDGIDRSACGGTHVRATGEIGPILVTGVDRIRDSTRVEFLCGHRALRRARADVDAMAGVAQAFSAAPAEVPALAQAQAERLRNADATIKKLTGELATYRARARYDAATPDASGVRRIVERRASGSLDDLRPIAQAMTELPKAIFIGVVEAPPVVLVAASDDSGFDAGRALKSALAAAGGRGGGSARMAQGTVPTPELLARVVESL